MINFITNMGYPFMLWHSFGLSLVSFYLNGRQHTVAGKRGARHTALAQKKKKIREFCIIAGYHQTGMIMAGARGSF